MPFLPNLVGQASSPASTFFSAFSSWPFRAVEQVEMSAAARRCSERRVVRTGVRRRCLRSAQSWKPEHSCMSLSTRFCHANSRRSRSIASPSTAHLKPNTTSTIDTSPDALPMGREVPDESDAQLPDALRNTTSDGASDRWQPDHHEPSRFERQAPCRSQNKNHLSSLDKALFDSTLTKYLCLFGLWP